VKLKAFLDMTSSPTMLGMHKRLAPDERSERTGLYLYIVSTTFPINALGYTRQISPAHWFS